MTKKSFYIVNTVTWWRVVMAPVLVVLAIVRLEDAFKWLLALSFLTDAIDGFLARKFHVTSRQGSRLDSLGDDLTVLAGIAGALIFRFDFVRQQLTIILLLGGLWLLQLILALVRYRRMTSFHTYIAKGAAVLQGLFLLSVFFFSSPPIWLFYIAAGATGLDLVEEIVMILMLKEWKADVKGLYDVLRS